MVDPVRSATPSLAYTCVTPGLSCLSGGAEQDVGRRWLFPLPPPSFFPASWGAEKESTPKPALLPLPSFSPSPQGSSHYCCVTSSSSSSSSVQIVLLLFGAHTADRDERFLFLPSLFFLPLIEADAPLRRKREKSLSLRLFKQTYI